MEKKVKLCDPCLKDGYINFAVGTFGVFDVCDAHKGEAEEDGFDVELFDEPGDVEI